ncbi:MAG: YybH family protein [Thermoanaerobaculia bacterium]
MRSRALHLTLVLLTVAALAACAPPAEPPVPAETEPAIDLAAEEQAIRDSSMQWLAAEQGRDLLTVMSFMDANVTSIFDGDIERGRAAVEAATQARWDANPDGTIEWATGAVHVAASGDLAYELGSWTTDPDGLADPTAEIGEFVCVWKKVDGEWKAVVDAGSTIKQSDS